MLVQMNTSPRQIESHIWQGEHPAQIKFLVRQMVRLVEVTHVT